MYRKHQLITYQLRFKTCNFFDDTPGPFAKRFWRCANKRCMDPFIGIRPQKEECPQEVFRLAPLVYAVVVEQAPEPLADIPIHPKKGDEFLLGCLIDAMLSPLMAMLHAVFDDVKANILEDGPGVFHCCLG